jgi:carboxylesterase
MPKKSHGVLILHGFPDSPDSMRPVEEPLKASGIATRTPLLRGLGADSPDALEGVTWHEWLADARSALMDLLKESEKAIVIGYSMGGALALMLAADQGDNLDSIILNAAAVQLALPFAPGRPLNFLLPFAPLFLKKWYFPPGPSGKYDWSYSWVPIHASLSVLDLSRTVRTRLSDVKVPTLLIQGRKDGLIAPENMEIIYNGISTPAGQKRMIWFEKSGHALFYGYEYEAIIEVITHTVLERMDAK